MKLSILSNNTSSRRTYHLHKNFQKEKNKYCLLVFREM